MATLFDLTQQESGILVFDNDGHPLPTAATVYTVGSVLVIAPDGWC